MFIFKKAGQSRKSPRGETKRLLAGCCESNLPLLACQAALGSN